MKIFNSIVLAILCWSVSATILTDDFIKAYEASNYNETIRLAKISINENDHNFDAWYYKGLSGNALYKFTDAVISFERAAELTTDKSAILFLLGNACESSGNSVKAIESYTKLVQLNSLNIQAKARLAKVYKGQKEYLKAIDLYSSLVELDSTNAYFYAQLAFCCKKFGLKDPAIRYYEKVIELNPNDVESGRLLINTYVDQKYYEDAAALVDTLLIRFPNNIQLLKRRAYILAIGGNYIGAIREFQNVVELGDSSMFTSKYYGHSLFNNGQYGEAIFWLNRYVNSNEDDTKNQFVLGLAYQKDYKYQKSLQHFHIAMGQVYDKALIAKVFTETGNTYAKFGDYLGFRDSTGLQAAEMYKLANQNYLDAFELVPADFEMYRIFGHFYEDKLKDKRMALYYYKKYYEEHDSHKIFMEDLLWVQDKITKLTEELHFMGD